MLKKLGVAMSFLCCSMIASTALAASNSVDVTPKQDTRQYYKSSSLIQTAEENVANGRGTLNGLMAFVREDATDDDAIKEIGFMSLARGNYIGLHNHSNTEEAYIILSGTGLLSDGKTERIVTKGDVAIARVGQQHGLRNIGRDPLLFISILAKNDGNMNTRIDSIGNGADRRQQVRQDIVEYRGQIALQRDKERRDAVQKAQADAKLKAEQEREQKVKEAKKSKEDAKKAREEQREKVRKAKADQLVQREIERENARLAREKARQEARNPKTAEQRSREAELRAAKEEEAIWAAKQRDKIRAANPTELNDEFAIGIK